MLGPHQHVPQTASVWEATKRMSVVDPGRLVRATIASEGRTRTQKTDDHDMLIRGREEGSSSSTQSCLSRLCTRMGATARADGGHAVYN